MNQATTAGVPALTFQSTTFDVVDRNGQPWLRGPQIGGALGYPDGGKAVSKLYDRNFDEFNERMTGVVKLTTPGGAQEVRIFSLRGAYLLGMLARTKVAKAFRVWALDVLEGQGDEPGDLQATVETAVLLQQQLTETERQRDALLAVVREQVLDKYPHFRKALKYHTDYPTLSYQEKATLMGWKSTTAWSECLRKMHALGLISYTPDPKLQQNGRAAMAKLRAMQGQAPTAPAEPKAPRKGSIRPRQGPISEQQAQHLEKMRNAAAASRARKRADLETARAALAGAAAKTDGDDKLH